MLGFLAGLFIGGAVGALAVCLCIAAADPGKGKRP
jgi:gas vesicle protein